MKKFILAAVATSLVATPLIATEASAQPRREHRETVVRHQPGSTVVIQRTTRQTPQYRNFRKGQRFDQRYARNYRQIDYRQYRNLRAPPRGYRYVQSGNDAVLVGITSGLIAAVIAGAIR